MLNLKNYESRTIILVQNKFLKLYVKVKAIYLIIYIFFNFQITLVIENDQHTLEEIRNV